MEKEQKRKPTRARNLTKIEESLKVSPYHSKAPEVHGG